MIDTRLDRICANCNKLGGNHYYSDYGAPYHLSKLACPDINGCCVNGNLGFFTEVENSNPQVNIKSIDCLCGIKRIMCDYHK